MGCNGIYFVQLKFSFTFVGCSFMLLFFIAAGLIASDMLSSLKKYYIFFSLFHFFVLFQSVNFVPL